jgi:hypothetical protein
MVLKIDGNPGVNGNAEGLQLVSCCGLAGATGSAEDLLVDPKLPLPIDPLTNTNYVGSRGLSAISSS